MTVFDDGSGPALYVAGNFTTAGGAPAKRIAKWNGTAWSGLADEIGPDGGIGALLVFDDGDDGAPDLYVGGTFTIVGELASPRLAELHGCDFRYTAFCTGDGLDPAVTTACPCANVGAVGRGCENSSSTGGALLSASGATSGDSIVLEASGELPSALSIFLQGSTNATAGVAFGDGVRCVGGNLKRLYVKNARGGVVAAPVGGEPSITTRSAALGDPIAPGTTRYYQVYYRDPNLAFCSAPQGSSFNVTSGIRVSW